MPSAGHINETSHSQPFGESKTCAVLMQASKYVATAAGGWALEAVVHSDSGIQMLKATN
jgi:hypothetical protein